MFPAQLNMCIRMRLRSSRSGLANVTAGTGSGKADIISAFVLAVMEGMVSYLDRVAIFLLGDVTNTTLKSLKGKNS